MTPIPTIYKYRSTSSFFCASTAELAQIDPATQKAIASGDPLALNVQQAALKRLSRLQQANQGDPAARLEIANDWADCVAEERPISDTQKQTTLDWLKASAKAGSAKSASTLGFMFAIGRGVAQNYNEAYHWYELSDARIATALAEAVKAHGSTTDQAERQVAYRTAVMQLVRENHFLILKPIEMRSHEAIRFSVIIQFEDCSTQAKVIALPTLDQSRADRMKQRLSTLLSKLTQTGLTCQGKNGQPVQWQVPYTINKQAI